MDNLLDLKMGDPSAHGCGEVVKGTLREGQLKTTLLAGQSDKLAICDI